MWRNGDSSRRTSSTKFGIRSGSARSWCCRSGSLGEGADGVAEQAGGGLAAGAEQGVQDDGGLVVAEGARLDAAGDGAEEVVAVGPRRAPSSWPWIHAWISPVVPISASSSVRVSVEPSIAVESNAALSSSAGSLSRKPTRR